ncbi:T6SS immunity protein Tdi1 domain-containing protein [Schlesneria sp. T3-172]|uniref:T6SS immunity protein Tdi1 domain-containing protein n=1 Tax=Schlesneria sphaerica TaxID=3373610 RepID=UPI0037C63D74
MRKFEEVYTCDDAGLATPPETALLDKVELHATGIKSFFDKYSGMTFNKGIFRVFPLDQVKKWTLIAEEMFPELKGKLLVIASDWRGQVYALNTGRKDGDQFQIQLLDPATNENLNVPATFEGFLDVELVDYANESLQVELFEDWIANHGPAPAAKECVAYIKPLRLGGIDDPSNQEITDMEVYWSFSTQIRQQIDGLPEGTRIDRVDLA